MKRVFKSLLLINFIMILWTSAYAQNQNDLKAATFFSVLKHINWSNAHKDGKFTIGVLDSQGDTYKHINQLYDRERLPNIPGKIRVRRVSQKRSKQDFNVIYICAGEVSDLAIFRQTLPRPKHTLLVTEENVLFRQGSSVNLEVYNERWGFRFKDIALKQLGLASKPILHRLSIDKQQADYDADISNIKARAKDNETRLRQRIVNLELAQGQRKITEDQLIDFLMNLTEDLDLEQGVKDSLLSILREKQQVERIKKEQAKTVKQKDSLQKQVTTYVGKDAKNQKKIEQQQNTIWIILLCFTVLITVVLYYYYLRQQKHLRWEKAARKDLSTQKHNLEQNIQAANLIQTAMLPSQRELQQFFPNHMLYFKPRDIVSGDFYWFTHKNERSYLAAIDCTGHGVQGAFMSMMVNEMLHKIIRVENVEQPGEILKHLHENIRKALRQKDTGNTDGVDMSMCVMYREDEQWQLEFAGAKNSLIYMQDGEFKQLKASALSIGGYHKNKVREFPTHHLRIEKDTTFYVYSDGYIDQLGGETRKRFGKKRFVKMLEELHQKEYDRQYQQLELRFDEWRQAQDIRQLDDVLILSWRLPSV